MLTDLGQVLGIPSSSIIEAFDVRQSLDFTVFFGLSMKVDESVSKVWVARPFELNEQFALTVLPIGTVGRIHDITIVSYLFLSPSYPS